MRARLRSRFNLTFVVPPISLSPVTSPMTSALEQCECRGRVPTSVCHLRGRQKLLLYSDSPSHALLGFKKNQPVNMVQPSRLPTTYLLPVPATGLCYIQYGT